MDKLTTIINNNTPPTQRKLLDWTTGVRKYGGQRLYNKIVRFSLLISRTKKEKVGRSDEIYTSPTAQSLFPFKLVQKSYIISYQLINAIYSAELC